MHNIHVYFRMIVNYGNTTTNMYFHDNGVNSSTSEPVLDVRRQQWDYNSSDDPLNTTLDLWNMTFDLSSPSPGNGTEVAELGFFMKNIRLLKAIVLGFVVVLLMLSTCKFVIKAFSKFNDADRKDEM